MSVFFPEIKKNFGFGCMRLPMEGTEAGDAEFCRMVDAFLEAGFNYFDTAHGYLGGKSETALRRCLTSRYPREKYILTNKLSTHHFTENSQIRPLFQSQLEACGVEYFDFYLMHAQDRRIFAKFKECRAYETALEFLAEGRIKHLGISFHGDPELLEQILTEYPQVEAVQIQLNYVDMHSPSVASGKCLEICRKFGKPAIIMEPVKGGALVQLPKEAQAIFDALEGGSYASYAIRYAASQEGVAMVLSGMGSMAMMEDNISYMKEFRPLDRKEQEAVEKVCAVFEAQELIPCTGCRYCVERCPQGIHIPEIFSCANKHKQFPGDFNPSYYYNLHTAAVKPADCLDCGLCEEICPQHLKIRTLLKEAAAAFEK